MSVKRWQINECEAKVKRLEAQLKEAMRVICNYIDYFENVGKDGLPLKRAKTRIEEIGKEEESNG